MVVSSDDDIRQLRDSLRRMLGTAKNDAPPAPDPEWHQSWKSLTELGVTALCVPEGRGGFGFHVEASVTVARELGAALHGSPYAGLMASVHALALADDAVAEDLVSGILAGERLCSFGVLGPSGRAAGVVDGAPEADALVLLDRSADELLLFSHPTAWEIHSPLPTFDMTRSSAEVIVNPAHGARIGGPGTARDLYGLLLAADALGCVEQMIDRTVAYASERKAFSRSIGGFQAVQHRLVDHSLRARGMALIVTEAARLLSATSPDARRFVALAQVGVGARAVHILHDLLQLTGAIGFTWEYGLHYYERRAHQDARLAANPRAAVRLVSEIEGWPGAR